MPQPIGPRLRMEFAYPGAANEQELCLVTLGRLVKAGLLPRGTAAGDALDTAVKERWAALRPGQPTPQSVGDLLLACVGDVEGDKRRDLDLQLLDEVGFVQANADRLRSTSTQKFSADEFVQLAGTHQGLRPTDTDHLVRCQDLFTDELGTGVETDVGRLDYVRSATGPALILRTTVNLSSRGGLVRGSAAAEDTYHRIEVTKAPQGPVTVQFVGDTAFTDYQLAPSGRLRPANGSIGKSIEAPDAAWMIKALFESLPAVQQDPEFGPVLEGLKAAARLRAQSTPPTDPAERAVWAGGRVPLDEVDRRIAGLTTEWGVRPLRWHGWCDDPSEVKTARAFLEATGGQTDIRPSFLYTVAIGEGLLTYLDQYNRFTDVDTSQLVGGFGHLGLDTFGSVVDGLKRKGLLPAEFRPGTHYTVTPSANERGENVVSADFPNLPTGLIALRAMLADCRGRFLADARAQLGAPAADALTRDQVEYFTYVYFNAGPTFGKRHLESEGPRAVRPWEGPPPASNTTARYNALQRLASLKLIDSMQLFPDASPLPAPDLQ